MPSSIGVNLRVTGHCSQGGRKYMEDFFSVAYQQSLSDERDLEYAFIGIYDGHGGAEAATFAKEHLINLIVNQKSFWSNDDRDVLQAIREGYIATHYAMWREQEKWPKTATGLPSTAGTTASVAFIRRGKIYIGHVGDSGIVLGYQEDGEKIWRAKPLTQDHKPECNVEKTRIMNSGGKVITKSGVPRVVWNRPRLGHKGPVRRSTPIDEIPFLAVARSLGDLWSYNSALNEFVVSPEPDVRVVKIDPKRFRCLIFGTDGLWNVLSPQGAVDNVRLSELTNVRNLCLGASSKDWTNPSKNLVDRALERWSSRRMRADNTSVVIIMLDPPGPPKRDVLKNCSRQQYPFEILTTRIEPTNENTETVITETGISTTADDSGDNFTVFDHRTNEYVELEDMPLPTSGLAIMTRHYPTSMANEHQTYHMHHVTGDASSSNTDVPYMSSFAESYNSLLNSSLDNDGSYVVADDDDNDDHHNHGLEDGGAGKIIAMTIDTYQLTKLQTRSEQQIHNHPLPSSSFCASSLSTWPHHSDIVQPPHFPVIQHSTPNHYHTNYVPAKCGTDTMLIHPANIAHSKMSFLAVDQPLPPAVHLQDMYNSNHFYPENQKVFQADYESEPDEEMSTVDLTISPATIEDLSELGKVINTVDSIQINEISSSEAIDDDVLIIDEPSSSMSTSSSLSPPNVIATTADTPAERIMTRSSQTQTTAVSSPRITRSTDRRTITKQSEKKRRNTALREKIDAIIQKRRSTTNASAMVAAIVESATATANNKFHKENISNVRKLRKNVVADAPTPHMNTRTRNASIRVPSPATIASTSASASNQRTLRSQNTVSKGKSMTNDAPSSASAKRHCSGSVAGMNSNNSNNNNNASNSNSGSSGSGSGKQPKRLTDTVQIVKNDATKLKTNVQQFLSTRQLRDTKLVALNNVSTTIRCKMMLAKKSMAVLPSRCSNSSSFLGDVARTMITRRTRLHH